ncbi:MAG: FKBP-type peptidyl-prolyl cis-trans isomerase, partial [Deltaproteobacteria bacterium]|nr:FKBP-type peptidyl-prolyl cis-trans isomerase [Deltaproteobacteria bacterium]
MSNLKWTTRCIELVVAAPAKNVVSYTALGSGVGSGGGGQGIGNMQHTIPRGTPLSTVGGREAAIAAEEISVNPPENGMACFDAHITMFRLDEVPKPRTARTYRLCADAKLVDGPPVVAKQNPYAAPDDVGMAPRDAKRTPAGVFYKRLVTGSGRKRPTAGDTVVVQYTGWTTDGKLFDSSLKRGQPARFPLRSVIAGWTDGLQVMVVGDKVRFWIPEELAYKG